MGCIPSRQIEEPSESGETELQSQCASDRNKSMVTTTHVSSTYEPSCSSKTTNDKTCLNPTIHMVNEDTLKLLEEIGELRIYKKANLDPTLDLVRHHDIMLALENPTKLPPVGANVKLFITDNAPPDVNYLLEFFRVHLTVTVLLSLLFIPKIVRWLKGRGDVYDTSGKLASVKGTALNHGSRNESNTNITQENDMLKDEIKKLYSQLEHMKMTSMEAGNRHLSHSTMTIDSTNSSNGFHDNTSGIRNNNFNSKMSRKQRKPHRNSPGTELISDFV